MIAAITLTVINASIVQATGRLKGSDSHLLVQAGIGLIVSTLERAQVEAMTLLKQTSEMPGQQVSTDCSDGFAS